MRNTAGTRAPLSAENCLCLCLPFSEITVLPLCWRIVTPASFALNNGEAHCLMRSNSENNFCNISTRESHGSQQGVSVEVPSRRVRDVISETNVHAEFFSTENRCSSILLITTRKASPLETLLSACGKVFHNRTILKLSMI